MDTSKYCEICGEMFDRHDHQPVVIPGCGHTFCRVCLIRMNNVHKEIMCPNCRHRHQGIRPEDLPVNTDSFSTLKQDEDNVEDDTSGEMPHSDNSNSSWKYAAVAGGVVVGGVALVAAVPVLVFGAGFTAAGIRAGSIAAKAMSITAKLCGGGVPAGAPVAVLQAIGVKGLGAKGMAIAGAVGGFIGGGIGFAAGGGSGNDESKSTGSSGENEECNSHQDEKDEHKGNEESKKDI